MTATLLPTPIWGCWWPEFYAGPEYQASAGSDSTSRKTEFCFKAIVNFEVNSTSYDKIRL
jgi:hypothetical protein